ncbi:MAG: hypothetical protein KDA83_04590, partial [Planctomycetales bacterium]|nr:hypothetical protein [Planctomycetales bacterium]
VSQSSDFLGRVVLAKIGKATFHQPVLPGDRLTYHIELLSLHSDGAVVEGTCHAGDQLQAELEMTFACLDNRFGDIQLFEPAAFLRLLRSLQLFAVGRTPTGDSIAVPPHMLAAEAAASL